MTYNYNFSPKDFDVDEISTVHWLDMNTLLIIFFDGSAIRISGTFVETSENFDYFLYWGFYYTKSIIGRWTLKN